MTAKSRKPWCKADALPCEDIYEDDGIDPRIFFKKPENRSSDRKVWQLCHQVRQTLEILWAEVELAVEWEIRDVTPAPHASRLQVTIIAEKTKVSERDIAELQHTIQSYQPRWREELALTIHRKRVPELTFQVMVFGGEP